MYSILKGLIDWTTSRTTELTDFNVGSAIRTLYEAVAVQVEEFYFRMKQNALYAITNSIYQAFNFERRVANKATGSVTVSFMQTIPTTFTIPAGTIFSTSEVYGYIAFESLEDTYVQPGVVSVSIQVAAKEAGTSGNVPQGAISVMVPTNTIVRRVYNEAAFTNGRNAETATEHKKRFQQYINSLAKATRNAILYGTLQVEGVTGAWVDDNYVGYVRVYAHNSDGELPDTLRAAIVNQLIDYRAGGIEIEVLSINKVSINQTIQVMIENDYDTDVYAQLIKTVVVSYLNEYTVGTNYHVADIVHIIKSSYEDVVINVNITNGKDVEIQKHQLIRPGDITVTCINRKNWRYDE